MVNGCSKTMDLLGSILGSMDKPPTKTKKDTNMYEKQKREYESLKNKQREELNRFRSYVEERLGRLIKDDNRQYMEFQSLDHVHRSIVHDISETAGLIGMSFGIEGERYIVVYKKEYLPCDDELHARKYGEAWNNETAAHYAEQRRIRRLNESDDHQAAQKQNVGNVKPKAHCTKKYMHLFGENSEIDVVRKTEINRCYGYVPSANKKDVRSIEQTMADIQAKKRLKTHHTEFMKDASINQEATATLMHVSAVAPVEETND